MPQSQFKGRVSRFLRAGFAGLAALTMGGAFSTGCLDRPVAPATPNTSNIFVSTMPQTAIDKIDLLFVVDNSISMADKQNILKDAVPLLVRRLVEPQLDASGVPEFKPVNDIHIGVVTSSLGGHGADSCSPNDPQGPDPTRDDKGHLIGTLRQNTNPSFDQQRTWNGFGFLAWDASVPPKKQPPGDNNVGDIVQKFADMVVATGESGCGFEATLEGWYRFLIDPTPPLDVVNVNGESVPQGIDETLLAQRRAFLRPDSLVAIIMLTDENDCSVIDGGIGWLSSQQLQNRITFHLPRSTSACQTDPNSPCCMSCATRGTNPDCSSLPSLEAVQADPGCQPNNTHDNTTDFINLRCWQQKRRYGVDFLYPTQRYVDALTVTSVLDRDRNMVPNPLFSDLSGGTAIPRDPKIVFLAGIVGVPWQDIATPDTLDPNVRSLTYMTAAEIRDAGRWDWIVGDVNKNIPPTDPLMVESTEPRGGANPATGAVLVPPTSTDPMANPINGHEWNTFQKDLQYACIFDLSPDKCCVPEICGADPPGCDCRQVDIDNNTNKPLCNPPGGGPTNGTQYFAKAYPGLRILQVLKDFGDIAIDNSIVASICPKISDVNEINNPDYGYNPAVSAIIERLKAALGIKCLPRKLTPDPLDEFRVPCEVIETSTNPLNCAGPARSPLELDDPLIAAVRKKLGELEFCGKPGTPACTAYHMCRINQFVGDQLVQCQEGRLSLQGENQGGYCYTDATLDARCQSEDPAVREQCVVATCPETSRQILSFVGDEIPAKGTLSFIACQGSIQQQAL